MALDELREARALTQEQLAETLGVRQATVSKMERRTDMYLSSLRKIIEAMGGELEIQAVFRAGRFESSNFETWAKVTVRNSRREKLKKDKG